MLCIGGGGPSRLAMVVGGRQAHPHHHGCASLRRGPPAPNETLGEDAGSHVPCVRPLASSPTALRCGGGGPSRLAMVVGGRQSAHPLHHGCASLRRGPPAPNETLGEDAGSHVPCVSPLASSPTALRCGGGGPSRLAMVVGGRRAHVPVTQVTGARPQPILRHAVEGNMCRVRRQSSGGSGGRSWRVGRRGLASRWRLAQERLQVAVALPRGKMRGARGQAPGSPRGSILDSTHAPIRQF